MLAWICPKHFLQKTIMEALPVKNQKYKHSSQFHMLSIYFLDHWDNAGEMQKSWI